MCGIAGIIDKKGLLANRIKKDKESINRMKKNMLNSMKDRGPDSAGEIMIDNVLMLHRRLAVVDLEGGAQPMSVEYKNKKYHIVYNGEIYNVPELRKELIRLGHEFNTTSDTEVLMRMLIEKGDRALDEINGIFAFAFYDEDKKKMIVARDRMGVKPFFYYEDDNYFIFASQIKTIMKTGLVSTSINKTGMCEIFMMGPGRSPGICPFNNIYELKRGEFGLVNLDRKNSVDKFSILQKNTYWDFKAKSLDMTFNETLDMTRFLIEDSIRRQLTSDIPVGCFLSGGLDSSIICKVVSDYNKSNGIGKLSTYSVDYEDNDKYFKKTLFTPNSDDYFINLMKKDIESKHKKVVLTYKDLAENLKDAVIARDVPGMVDIDSSLLAFSREVKKDYSVMLSGECADELFFGYPWYTNEKMINAKTFPWALEDGVRLNILNDDTKRKLDGANYIRTRYDEEIRKVSRLLGETKKETRMREMFMLNVDYFMQTLLDRKDRMTMATGLEVRVPFCDYRLADLAYNMRLDYKLYKGREKGIVREAFRGILPDEIVFRKKSPYPKTFDPRYFNLVCQMLDEILKDDSSYINRFINKDSIYELMKNPGDMEMTWYGQLMKVPQIIAYLYQVEVFFRMYNVEIVLD